MNGYVIIPRVLEKTICKKGLVRTVAREVIMKRIILFLALGLTLVIPGLVSAPRALAQGTSAYDQVSQILAKEGYTTLYAGYLLDSTGQKQDTSSVYVTMLFSPNAPNVKTAMSSTSSDALTNAYYAHTIAGFRALREVFPNASKLTVIVIDGWISSTFVANGAVFDSSELSGASQAVFKSNQVNNVLIINLATGAGTNNNSAGQSAPPVVVNPTATRRPLPTATPKPAASIDSPCEYFARAITPGKFLLYVRNQYMGRDMTFTIGGPPWGTHDYKIPGDRSWYYQEIPPGNYTWTATIAGLGQAGSGPKKSYPAGGCDYIDFRG